MRLLFVMCLVLFGFSAFAEIDVEDQIRMAEDPNYLEYLRERDREEAHERAAGYEYAQVRAREAADYERARKEYVEWRDRQPIEDNSKEELADLKEKASEAAEYQRRERVHADHRYQQDRLQFVAQQKLLRMNRRPASVLPPRTPRKLRKFSGATPFKLKKVSPGL